MPHRGKLFRTKDDVNDVSSVDGRVGVHRSCDLFNARHHVCLLLLGASDYRVAAGALAVETEVFGERLEKHNVVGVFLEKLQRVGVLLKVTRSETLVSRVKSREQFLLLDNFEHFLPLGFRGVDASGVVRAHVEHHQRVRLGGRNVSLHTLKVQSFGFLRVVTVLFEVVSNEVGNVAMNGPGGVGDEHIDVLVRVPFLEELETETERSSSGDGLSSSDAAFLESLRIGAISQFEALLDVGVNAGNGSVLVIGARIKQLLLGASHALKNVGLALIVAIGTHSKEHLLGVGVHLEGFIEAEDRVGGGGSESSPVREARLLGGEHLAATASNEFGQHFS